ncbi:MAG: hypothetical protein M0P71_17405 [Melioribacteraceae bacterium]|nr:hypothetical protein [Melioribacteraceae bacterium]
MSRKIASADTLETGIANKTGILGVSYTTALGVHHSAVYALYDSAGTPTTVLLAGNGTQFTITETTASKVNVYWKTNEVEIENNSGAEIQITLEGDFYNV